MVSLVSCVPLQTADTEARNKGYMKSAHPPSSPYAPAGIGCDAGFAVKFGVGATSREVRDKSSLLTDYLKCQVFRTVDGRVRGNDHTSYHDTVIASSSQALNFNSGTAIATCCDVPAAGSDQRSTTNNCVMCDQSHVCERQLRQLRLSTAGFRDDR